MYRDQTCFEPLWNRKYINHVQITVAESLGVENRAGIMNRLGRCGMGKTPTLLYQKLAQSPFIDDMPWTITCLFWGDKRFVPHNHPDSNYGLVRDGLLSKLKLPEQNIFPVSVTAGCGGCVGCIRKPTEKLFCCTACTHSFDLVLLVVGSDRHTA